ncbi:MAG: acyltransferase [Lachnospiraceae bacterium]|nr:acyltransferase [Lachnospiraceae bacterium]
MNDKIRKNENRRNIALDSARGLAIIIIVIYHLVYKKQNGFFDNMVRESGWCIVPFFFAITGYFHDPQKRNIKETIIYREKALLIPTIRVTLIAFLLLGIYCVIFHGYTAPELFRDFVYTYLRPEISSKLIPDLSDPGMIFYYISAVWFIWTMAWSLLLFIPLAAFVSDDTKKNLICCLGLIIINIPLYLIFPKSPWNLAHVPVYTAIMLFGMLLRNTDLRERLNSLKPLAVVCITAAAVILHVLLYKYCGTDAMFDGVLGTKGWISVPVFFIQTFIGSIVLITLGRLISHTDRPAAFFSYTGKNSFFVLLLHLPFGLVYTDLLHNYHKLGTSYWYLELAGIELTPVIIVKSVIIAALSVLSSLCAALLRDHLSKKKK